MAALTKVVHRFAEAGIQTVMTPDEASALSREDRDRVVQCELEGAVDTAELVIVLGGDGTILRAAEIVRGATPRCWA